MFSISPTPSGCELTMGAAETIYLLCAATSLVAAWNRETTR